MKVKVSHCQGDLKLDGAQCQGHEEAKLQTFIVCLLLLSSVRIFLRILFGAAKQWVPGLLSGLIFFSCFWCLFVIIWFSKI